MHCNLQTNQQLNGYEREFLWKLMHYGAPRSHLSVCCQSNLPKLHRYFISHYLLELLLLPLVVDDDGDRPGAEEAPALEVHDRPRQQSPLRLEGLEGRSGLLRDTGPSQMESNAGLLDGN